MIKSELPGGVPFDLAAPVQGHYGAMRNAGAEGSTYLHTQLMQVLLPPPLGRCLINHKSVALCSAAAALRPDTAELKVSLGRALALRFCVVWCEA